MGDRRFRGPKAAYRGGWYHFVSRYTTAVIHVSHVAPCPLHYEYGLARTIPPSPTLVLFYSFAVTATPRSSAIRVASLPVSDRWSLQGQRRGAGVKRRPQRCVYAAASAALAVRSALRRRRVRSLLRQQGFDDNGFGVQRRIDSPPVPPPEPAAATGVRLSDWAVHCRY